MMNEKQMGAAMIAVTDQLDAVLAAHERADHGGEMCVGNRVSAVAFIAHWIGVNTFRDSWPIFVHTLKRYEDSCDACQRYLAEQEDDK